MTILFANYNKEPEHSRIDRIKEIILERWGEDILFAGQGVSLYASTFGVQNYEIASVEELFLSEELINKCSRIVIVKDAGFKDSVASNVDKPVYTDLLFGFGGLRLVCENSGIDDFKHWNDNIFNKISSCKKNSNSGFLDFFPAILVHRYNGQGSTGELGFRVEDISVLKKRADNDMLVVILGNSGSFDPYCVKKSTFSYKLEQLLNGKYKNSGKNIIVANFSMPSATVNDELNILTNIIWNLKPEIIISHTGYTDVTNGLRQDIGILERYGIFYTIVEEIMSCSLSGVEYKDVRWNYHIIENICNELIKRRVQMTEMCSAMGSTLVLGLQPFFMSKKKGFSSQETFLFEATGTNPKDLFNIFTKKIYDLLSFVCPQYLSNFIDFHAIFGNVTQNLDCFGDAVHILDSGNKIIAEKYLEVLSEIIDEKIKDKKQLSEQKFVSVDTDFNISENIKRLVVVYTNSNAMQLASWISQISDVEIVFAEEQPKNSSYFDRDVISFEQINIESDLVVISSFNDKQIIKINEKLVSLGVCLDLIKTLQEIVDGYVLGFDSDL